MKYLKTKKIFENQSKEISALLNDINVNNIKGIQEYIDKGYDLDYKDEDGDFALIYATLNYIINISDGPNNSKGEFSTIEFLIDAGANWNIKDNDNKTFCDYLEDKDKEKLKDKYPDKYGQYISSKLGLL